MASADDIDKLVAMGQLTPETAAAFKMNQGAPTVAQEAPAAPAVIPTQANLTDILANAAPTAQPNGPQATPINLVPTPMPTADIPQASPTMDPGQAPLAMQPMTPAAPGTLVSDQQAQAAQQTNPAQQAALGAFNNINNTFDQEKSANSAAAKAGAQQATKEAAYLETLNQKAEEQAAISQQKEMTRQQRLQDQQNLINGKLDEYNKMSLDPNKANVFMNGSLGQKIGAGIGVALSGIGSGLGGGENLALKTINSAIDRDIQAQMANIDKKQKGIDNARGVYRDMLTTFGDDRSAESAARAALIQSAQLKLQQTAAQYKSPQILAQAQALNAQLERQKQSNIMNVMQSAAMQPAAAGADEQFQKILRIPKQFQDNAIKEKGAIDAYTTFQNDMVKEFSSMNKIGAVDAKLPGYLGGNQESYKAARGKIAGAIIGKVPGIKSDKDFEEVVDPILPKPGDTSTQAAKKLKIFQGFLQGQAPSTPILQGFGIRTAPAELKTLKPNQ